MKKSILFFLPVLMISVLFTSCSKDEVTDLNVNGNNQHFVSFKMDGQDFKSRRYLGLWC